MGVNMLAKLLINKEGQIISASLVRDFEMELSYPNTNKIVNEIATIFVRLKQ